MLRSLMIGLPILGALANPGFAGTIASYANPGIQNPVTYTFTATGGDVSAYFAGSGANFIDSLGLLVNGVDTGITGLVNHGPGLGIGKPLDFGSIAAGSVLVFYIKVADSYIGDHLTYYSDSHLNSDGVNHVYAYHTNSSGVWDAEVGTYIGFEDLSPVADMAFGGADYNYTDEQIVVTGVTGVPELSTWAMLLAGFAGIGCRTIIGRRAGGGKALSSWKLA
jgi:hypothetical protein